MPAQATHLATRTFGCLDGLRALAIVAVVKHHAVPPGHGIVGLDRGFLGVDLFFAISGYLIVTLLLRERDRRGGIDLGASYMRRLLRIVPLNHAVVAASVGLAHALHGPRGFRALASVLGHRAVAPVAARLGAPPPAARLALALALSWLLAEASFRTFERWFLRRKAAWAR